MAKGGSIQKFILNGLERSLSSDNDPTFTRGGRKITETQDTNNGIPFALIDNITGVLSGIEERVSISDGTYDTLVEAMELSIEGGVSCSFINADGSTVTAKGGVYVIPDDAAGGEMTIREGKATYSVKPTSGKWV